MQRLFTAFVSSTFFDLRDERQRLVSVLRDQGCLPWYGVLHELLDIEWAFKASGDGSDTWHGHDRGAAC